MLWPLALPMQITFVIFAAINFVLLMLPKSYRWGTRHPFFWGLRGSLILFIPACWATMLIVDQYRFGWATFAETRGISDERVLRYFPDHATEIALFRRPGGNGFIGRFKISQVNLTEWHEANWERFLSMNGDSIRKDVPSEAAVSTATPDEFAAAFRESDWKPPEDGMLFRGPTARNGAGYRVFYSSGQQQAYIRADYW